MSQIVLGGWSEWKEVDSKAQEVFDKMEPKQEGKVLQYKNQVVEGYNYYFLATTDQYIESLIVYYPLEGEPQLIKKECFPVPYSPYFAKNQ